MLRLRGALVVAAVCGAVAAVASPAVALSPAPPPAWLAADLQDDGLGSLSSLDPVAAWERCDIRPDGFTACVPVTPGADGRLAMTAADTGRAFFATRPDGTRGVAVYSGPVRVGAPPAVEGPLRVGAVVRVRPADWHGGFGIEQSLRQLQACRDAAGSDCFTVSSTFRADQCDQTGVTLPARYEGLWLRAVERRAGSQLAFPAIAYPPEGVPLQPVEGPLTTVSELVGPIAAGAGRAGCRPAAHWAGVLFDSAATRTRGGLRVGRVHAERVHTVAVVLRRGRRTVRLVVRPRGARWTPIVVPAERARRLGSGTWRVTVDAGDTTTREGRVPVAARLLPRR